MGELVVTNLSSDDLEDLKRAKIILNSPSFTAKLGEVIGKPLESGIKYLPRNWRHKVSEATEAALFKGLEYSIQTMGGGERRPSRDWLHKAIVVASGAAAGAAGFYSIVIELPFSTVVMLRSIADIARSEGHDISTIDVRLACLEVFALGGGGEAQDSAETGYWAIRAALAVTLRDAASHITERGFVGKAGPPVVRLITTIAARFGVVVTAEAAAVAIPVVGAVSGGAVNYLFMDHFQSLARAHFIIKRLENKYGTGPVREAYDRAEV